MPGELRRQKRCIHRGKFRVSWEDSHGVPKFATVRGCDISRSGIRVALPEAVSQNSLVVLQSKLIKFAFSGRVRHCVRHGSDYLTGIEFSAPLAVDIETLPES